MRTKLINFIYDLITNHLPIGTVNTIIDCIYPKDKMKGPAYDLAVSITDRILPQSKYYFEVGTTNSEGSTETHLANATFDQCMKCFKGTIWHSSDKPVFIDIWESDGDIKEPIGKVELY